MLKNKTAVVCHFEKPRVRISGASQECVVQQGFPVEH